MNVIHFIAVKLSVITTELIGKILETYHGTVIIDAEYQRLDHWYLANSSLDFSRLILTVQVSRQDAEEQVNNLDLMGIKVLLVRGNSSYVSHREGWLKVMGDLWDMHDNVQMLGISRSILQKLCKNVSREIRNKDVLELYGYQSLEGSMLYTYVSLGNTLSEAANQYIMRRGREGKFIVRDRTELEALFSRHTVVLYVDYLNQMQYIKDIITLTEEEALNLCEK